MTPLRQRIRELAAKNVAFTVPVAMRSITRISATFVRVAVTGEELEQYVDPRLADAFNLMLPPRGSNRFDLPFRGEDRLPYWPEGAIRPVLRAATVRAFEPNE